MTAHVVAELTQHLHARQLYPSAAWIQSFAAALRPSTPLPAAKQTALFRVLATNITASLKQQPAASVFPADVLDAKIQARTLTGPVVCQVLDMEDIGTSRWSQVESIEANERGEMTKGREIVRVIEREDGNDETVPPVGKSKGPFKLLLQDARGVRVYAIDLRGIEGIGMNMSLGLKLVLRNASVRRAVVMLEPASVQILGGRIDALDKTWKEGRKERLMNAAKIAGETAM